MFLPPSLPCSHWSPAVVPEPAGLCPGAFDPSTFPWVPFCLHQFTHFPACNSPRVSPQNSCGRSRHAGSNGKPTWLGPEMLRLPQKLSEANGEQLPRPWPDPFLAQPSPAATFLFSFQQWRNRRHRFYTVTETIAWVRRALAQEKLKTVFDQSQVHPKGSWALLKGWEVVKQRSNSGTPHLPWAARRQASQSPHCPRFPGQGSRRAAALTLVSRVGSLAPLQPCCPVAVRAPLGLGHNQGPLCSGLQNEAVSLVGPPALPDPSDKL